MQMSPVPGFLPLTFLQKAWIKDLEGAWDIDDSVDTVPPYTAYL